MWATSATTPFALTPFGNFRDSARQNRAYTKRKSAPQVHFVTISERVVAFGAIIMSMFERLGASGAAESLLLSLSPLIVLCLVRGSSYSVLMARGDSHYERANGPAAKQ